MSKMVDKEFFHKVKEEIRILGVDDGSFSRSQSKTLLVGSVFRGGSWMDGLMSSEISVDGRDATDKLIDMIKSSKYEDIRVIMLHGVTVAGFNIFDVKELFEETGLPVIVFIESRPEMRKIKKALKNLEDWEKRLKVMKKTGEVNEMVLNKKVYFQVCGISKKDAERIIEISSTRGDIPEPLRISHIIATGITEGESTKR